MKKSFKLISLISISVFIGFLSSVAISQVKLKPLDLVTSEDYQKKFLSEVVKAVKKEYVEQKTNKELYEAAAEGLLNSLDPHSSYLDEDDFKEMQVQTRGNFGGLGIEITMEHQLVKIIAPIDDTPAAKAGIKAGDYISKIEGKSVVGLKIDDVVKKLRGKPRTEVTITLLRKGEKGPIVKTLKRDNINVKPVKFKIIDDVGYVKINTFSQRAAAEVEDAIKKIRKDLGKTVIKGLVLDLRNNPGGLLDQAVEVSEIFLDRGRTIVSIKGRNKDKEIFYKDNSNERVLKDKPVVVLINGGSASASEIVAGALQDNKRAIIAGEKSFGKGSVQTLIPVDHNKGALRVTTALYYTPNKVSIQAEGIVPDVYISETKIQEISDNNGTSSEADLNGHIQAQIDDEIRQAEGENQKNKRTDSALYKEDYQLARAVDLIKAVSVYQK